MKDRKAETIKRRHYNAGAKARRPAEMPRKAWLQVLLRTYQGIDRDNLSLIAAGVSFYVLLALFPAITAGVSIYGLFANPAEVAGQLKELSAFIPMDVLNIVITQLESVAARDQASLGFSAMLGVLVAVWSAGKGFRAMLLALNIAYQQKEHRGLIAQYVMGFVFTLAAVLSILLVFAVVFGLPLWLEAMAMPAWLVAMLKFLRWPLLLFSGVISLAVLYRYGPNRANPRWIWVTWGALIAACLWMLGSIGFNTYVSMSDSYSATYGSLGAVMILLMWLYISVFIALVGAEFNGELELQTAADTTTGEPRPMGQRGAYVADNVAIGQAHSKQSDVAPLVAEDELKS